MFQSEALTPVRKHRWISRALLGSAGLLLFPVAPSQCQGQTRPMDELRRMSESVDALIRKVSPSVVQILVSGYGQIEEPEHGNTGVVIGADDYSRRLRNALKNLAPGAAVVLQIQRDQKLMYIAFTLD